MSVLCADAHEGGQKESARAPKSEIKNAAVQRQPMAVCEDHGISQKAVFEESYFISDRCGLDSNLSKARAVKSRNDRAASRKP